MIERILIIIDMQEGAARGKYHGRHLYKEWWARHSAVVANILKLLENFNEVIFVVYAGFRRQEYKKIIEELKGAARGKPVLFKNEDDGSDVLAPYIPRKAHAYACGMNTDACVLRTVRGLKRKGFRVTVVGDACWTAYASESPTPHTQALRAMRRSGIPVVNTAAVR